MLLLSACKDLATFDSSVLTVVGLFADVAIRSDKTARTHAGPDEADYLEF